MKESFDNYINQLNPASLQDSFLIFSEISVVSNSNSFFKIGYNLLVVLHYQQLFNIIKRIIL